MDRTVRNNKGEVIASIETKGERMELYDSKGRLKGYYTQGKTYDSYGSYYGDGNLLMMLLHAA